MSCECSGTCLISQVLVNIHNSVNTAQMAGISESSLLAHELSAKMACNC